MDENMAYCKTVCSSFLVLLTVTLQVTYSSEVLQFCSFFGNRGPKPQSNLRNCTWFQSNTCCMQEEIDATFGKVKPLIGASPACQRYTNYLMCYICAPYQNRFYKFERLTVCEEFCDDWFQACGSAILKGVVIKDLYNNGKAFCKGRSFEVDTYTNLKCYNFDPKLDKTSMGCSIIVGFELFSCLVCIAWVLNRTFYWLSYVLFSTTSKFSFEAQCYHKCKMFNFKKVYVKVANGLIDFCNIFCRYLYSL